VPVLSPSVGHKKVEGLSLNIGSQRLCSRRSAAAVGMGQDNRATPAPRVRSFSQLQRQVIEENRMK